MRRTWSIVVLAVALGCLVLIALEQNSDQGVRESFYSTNDNGPNGYLALYNILHGDGVRVERFEREIALLPPGQTVVLTSNQPERDSPTVVSTELLENDSKRLTEYARKGGHVVLLTQTGKDGLLSGFTHSPVEATGSDARPVVETPLTQGVAAVYAPYSYVEAYKGIRHSYPILGTKAGAIAYVHPVGKGDVTILTTAKIFSNADITKAENARLAFNLLDRGTIVYFDEWLHGYSADKTFWGALPEPVHVAVYLCAVMLLVFLIGANIRMAPAIPLDPPDERDSSAYIASMAQLLRRAKAGHAAIARFADDAARLLRRRDRPELAQPFSELTHLAAQPRPTNADVQRAAALHALIRKDAQ